MAFRPGGEYLPFDWVDEGKLLLFMKTQVAERAPRKGSRLAAERKRRLENEMEGPKRQGKKGKWGAGAGTGTMAEQAERTLGAPDSRHEELELEPELESELQLMYNLVRGYVSAIMELWSHQVSTKLHSSPSPHNVVVKALKTSIA
jgi:hypothetical protein